MKFIVKSIKSRSKDSIIAILYLVETEKEIEMKIINDVNGCLGVIMMKPPIGIYTALRPFTSTRMELKDVVVGTEIDKESW